MDIDSQALRIHKLFVISIICVCLFSLACRYYMTERMPFIMDELVDTQIACQMAKGTNLYSNYVWERTPLMNFIIGMAVGSGENSFLTAVNARKVMWVATIIVFIMTFLISRKVYNSDTGWLAILLLCSFTTFLDRSIRVRADMISSLLSLPVLLILVCSEISIGSMCIAGFFLGLSLLTSQKAIIFIISFGIAFIAREVSHAGLNLSSLKKITVKIFFSLLGFLIPIGIFIIWLFVTDQVMSFIREGILHALDVGFVRDTYKNATRIYFRLTIFQNPAFWFLGVTGIILYLLKGIRKGGGLYHEIENTKHRSSYLALSVWTLSILILIMRHKVKFPYIFLNISSPLAICASYPLYLMLLLLKKRTKTSSYYLNLLFVIVTCCSIIIPFITDHPKNLKIGSIINAQHAIMNRVDSITKIDDSIFDGIGIAVTRKTAVPYSMTARWFDERAEGLNYDIIGSLRKSQPKAMILNYRLESLPENEKEFLSANFIWDWANVFVVGSIVKHDGQGETIKTINLLSSAEYAVLAANRNNILIDRRIPGNSIFLTSGDHDVSIHGEKQQLVLKYFPAVRNSIPFQKPFNKLFPSYSE
jgi:hypothetical protein